MEIIRDEKRIDRMATISRWASLIGMGVLVVGLVLAFTSADNIQNVAFYQLIALAFGWLLSQVGIYLSHRYLRDPRPDEVLDDALRKAVPDGRLYHYVLPAPHVLLTPEGVIILVAKYQGGDISVEGDKWKQKGVGLRRFFGQEGLGNPTKEAETLIKSMANFIRKNAPSVEELPIGALIVFTTKGVKNLDLDDSRIPAMHFTKVKGFLRQQKREAIPEEDYEALRAAFDEKAGDILA